jgi:peptidyl-prolyl cis-trans isomerase D
MLKNMRAASKSWIVRGLFAILILAFVLIWGVADVFQGGRMTDHSVATVGDKKISLRELITEAKLITTQSQQGNGQAIEESVAQQRALQELVYNALLDQEADHLGLAISDKQILEMVKSAPMFQDREGHFNRQLFEAVARSEGLTVKGFEEALRQQSRRNQLIQLVSTGLNLPKSYLIPLYQWQHEKRVVDWVNIQPSNFTKLPAPSAEDLRTYYDGHQDEFTRPEQRDITVVILSEENLKGKVQLTDEEIQAGFSARQGDSKAALPTKAETDKIMKELKSEKAIDEFNRLTTTIEDNVAGGVPLEELAKKHDLILVKIDGLQRNGAAKTKASLSGEAMAEAAEQGFKQEPGEEPFLSQLTNGEYMMARVDKVHESKLLPFEEVQKDIEKDVTAENQHKAAKELGTKLVEQINGGVQLAQLAKENNLEMNTDVSINRLEEPGQGVSLGLRAIAFITNINKAAIAPGDKGSFAVVVPRKIIEPKIEDIKEDELKAFKANLDRNMVNDMLMQYMASLERRYHVELNKAALETLQK